MFGFLFGSLCLAGFVWMWRRPMGRRFHGGGPWGVRRVSRRGLRFVFRRLDTSPGQERLIREAADEVIARGSVLLDALASSRREVGRAFSEDEFDADRVVEELMKPDDALAELRASLAARLFEIHSNLDPEQRRRLGELLGRRGRPHFGGPYRSAC